MKPIARSILILFLIGMFVSVQQVSSEEIVECGGREFSLEHLAGAGTALSIDRGECFFSYGVDTLETFDIELEEKEENLYKEIAIAAIVAVMVGYMVITLISPGEDEKEPSPNGKDIPGPFVGISVPISP